MEKNISVMNDLHKINISNVLNPSAPMESKRREWPESKRKKKRYKADAPNPAIMATSIDLGPMLSKENVGKKEPESMKNAKREDKMAPALTMFWSIFKRA